MKTLGEALERYSLAIYRKKNFVLSPYAKLTDDALDPSTVVSFSQRQLQFKGMDLFMVDQKAQLWWTKGFSLIKNRSVYVPAQLVFLPYNFEEEKCIRFPISTGAAAGSSLEGAIERGILEIIERDAFMVFYLNQLIPYRLSFEHSENKLWLNLDKTFKRYNLHLLVFDITTDIDVTTIMAILIDETGKGPGVSIGLKSSLSPEKAILGAIEEAQHTRIWIRDEMVIGLANHAEEDIEEIKLKKRGLYWSKVEMIDNLGFFIKSRKIINIDDFIRKKTLKVKSELKYLIDWFKKLGIDVISVDVTEPQIKKVGFFVVRVVIPQMQPLYLDENYRYLGGQRLYNLPKVLGFRKTFSKENELNKIPHPFL